MKDEVYNIGGMHCAACSGAVERVTKKLPGVKQSEVNLPMNRLTISYDETLCTPEEIISKVENAGFTAKLHRFTDEKISSTDNDKNNTFQEKTALIVSVCFSGVLLLVSMGHMIFPAMPMPDIISADTHPVNFALLQMLLCIPVLFFNKHFFIGGFGSLLHGNPNMDTLVAVSSSASFIYSLVMTFLLTDNVHNIHNLYFESAAVVVALVSVGKYLETINKEKTKDAIAKLMKLTPDTAILTDENGQWEVPVKMLKVGDTVIVKPGARIPLDGIVTSGSGSVNEAMLTGESLPVEKSEGSEVIGGSVSADGVLYVKITRVGEDTTLSKIIKFVEDAQGKKAPISKAADKVAGVFVPIVMAVAIISAIIWLLAGEEFSFALKIFTCILVIACPCAMGLATPTAIIVGTGIGASKGILIRNGEALEITHKTDIVIFDKTGTITEGNPTVTDIVSENETELLQTAYSLERLSAHPISKAICKAAVSHGIEADDDSADGFESIAGRGLIKRYKNGTIILAGNAAFMKDNDIPTEKYSKELEHFQLEGKTVVFVAQNKKVLGLIAVSDTIKTDAAETMAKLREMDIKTVLLTGDNRAAAEYIGTAVGSDEIVAEVLPTEKANVVKSYQEKGKTVMMVGDGINDAPALVQADTGCAVGSGSDIAIDSADIVLMKSDLMDVCRAIRLSRHTIRNIKQNLFWAFCYNTLGIPIAAGIFYPSLHLLLSPMIGAIAMSLSSLFVVTNALRLKGKKI